MIDLTISLDNGELEISKAIKIDLNLKDKTTINKLRDIANKSIVELVEEINSWSERLDDED